MHHQNDIIERIRNGKTRDLTRLYKYYPVVKKWLALQGCQKQDAMDIYQEALVIFCDKCHDRDFTLTSSIDTYLFAVSRNLFRAKNRSDAKVKGQSLDETDIEIRAEVNDWKGREAKLNYAFKALEMISDKCREILELFYLKKKTMEEIADKLGLRNVRVAKTRKYKCLMHAKEKALNLLNEE